MIWDKNTKKVTDQLVFNRVRECGPISKRDLSELVGASISTVSSAVEMLVKSGKVKRTDIGDSSGGRKPALYKINGSSFLAIGVVINQENIQMIIMDLDGRILDADEYEMGNNITPNHFVESLKTFIERVLDEKNRTKLLGIGIAIKGPIDQKNGITLTTLGYPSAGWMNVSLRDLVARETGMRVFVNNRAQAGALAELWYGAAREFENVVFIYNRRGIGSGIVTHRRLLESNSDILGSLGHMAIVVYRDNNNAVEILNTVSPLDSIVSEAEKSLPNNRGSVLYEMTRGRNVNLTYDMICSGVEKGDRLCVELISKAARLFGLALANFVNVLRPEIVVIGGETVDKSALYYDITVSTAKEMVYTFGSSESIRFSKPSLGGNEIEIGAATFVFNKALSL
jgi:predicted NBD/HSP70 family sugar kinase